MRGEAAPPPGDAAVVARLQDVGLRPTRQRVALAGLMFSQPHRHFTADELHAQAQAACLPVSLATVYNTLNQFTEAGLLREVVVEQGRSWFDTNLSDHHHFFYEDSGELKDIPAAQIGVTALPMPPIDAVIERVEVIIRVRRRKSRGRA